MNGGWTDYLFHFWCLALLLETLDSCYADMRTLAMRDGRIIWVLKEGGTCFGAGYSKGNSHLISVCQYGSYNKEKLSFTSNWQVSFSSLEVKRGGEFPPVKPCLVGTYSSSSTDDYHELLRLSYSLLISSRPLRVSHAYIMNERCSALDRISKPSKVKFFERKTVKNKVQIKYICVFLE